MPKNTNKEVITCNDPNIKGEKTIQIALNKEQRVCLLDTIVLSKREHKHECLLPVIKELEKYVREEDPERYKTIYFKCCVMSNCDL